MTEGLSSFNNVKKSILSRHSTFTSRITPSMQPTANGDERLDSESSTSTDDLQGVRCIDPDKTVLLRFECISAKELKVCFDTRCLAKTCLSRQFSSTRSQKQSFNPGVSFVLRGSDALSM